MPLPLHKSDHANPAQPPYRLVEEVLARSHADDWAEARAEWDLAEVYLADEPGTCLCGHAPIVECCVLVNRVTGWEVLVGNVCVTRFLGLPADRIFASVRRVLSDRDATLSPEAVAHAHARGWLNDWERSFYRDTCRRKRLTGRQRDKRNEINDKVLARLNVGLNV